VAVSNYIVELDHEGGKGFLAHKDKIAVFVQKSGDSIFSESTLSVGGSVQDACAAVLAHWAAHSAELKVVEVTPTAVQANVAPVAVAAPASSITVDASTPNCDIEVDGGFVGNTPSTINLTPGKHEVVVKKAGYKDWARNMNVSGGAIHLNADMVVVQ
jgi:diacylglycerol kinase family enzyme